MQQLVSLTEEQLEELRNQDSELREKFLDKVPEMIFGNVR